MTGLLWGIHRWPVNSPHKKGQWRGKCLHLMTSSWAFTFHSKEYNLSVFRLWYISMMMSWHGNNFHITGPFVRGTHRSPVGSPHKWPLMRSCDVFCCSSGSCCCCCCCCCCFCCGSPEQGDKRAIELTVIWDANDAQMTSSWWPPCLYYFTTWTILGTATWYLSTVDIHMTAP